MSVVAQPVGNSSRLLPKHMLTADGRPKLPDVLTERLGVEAIYHHQRNPVRQLGESRELTQLSQVAECASDFRVAVLAVMEIGALGRAENSDGDVRSFRKNVVYNLWQLIFEARTKEARQAAFLELVGLAVLDGTRGFRALRTLNELGKLENMITVGEGEEKRREAVVTRALKPDRLFEEFMVTVFGFAHNSLRHGKLDKREWNALKADVERDLPTLQKMMALLADADSE